jgi:hypothetical protein
MDERDPGQWIFLAGASAFTLGVSLETRTIDHIKRQAEHHQKRSFKLELLGFLKTPIDYDPKYVWG